MTDAHIEGMPNDKHDLSEMEDEVNMASQSRGDENIYKEEAFNEYEGAGDSGRASLEEMPTELAAILRQANLQIDKTAVETKQVLNGLLEEITEYLATTEMVRQDFIQVQRAVHHEANRLDGLEPQIVSATFLSPNSCDQPTASMAADGSSTIEENDGY